MPTWTQDYLAYPGSIDTAVAYADAIVGAHIPGRTDDARKVMAELFAVALARSGPLSSLNLTTIFTTTGPKIALRFELCFPNDVAGADAELAHKTLSALSDTYGEQRDRQGGRMIYAELWGCVEGDSRHRQGQDHRKQ
ncbi:hypothetical protein ACFOY2_16005 [Nonomuraea purpurea]|uniref:Isomerase n=1 Tax=Nonomuraea purpurea TaxID=1849276 RepID=A0ABV8G426_9ACTN